MYVSGHSTTLNKGFGYGGSSGGLQHWPLRDGNHIHMGTWEGGVTRGRQLGLRGVSHRHTTWETITQWVWRYGLSLFGDIDHGISGSSSQREMNQVIALQIFVYMQNITFQGKICLAFFFSQDI